MDIKLLLEMIRHSDHSDWIKIPSWEENLGQQKGLSVIKKYAMYSKLPVVTISWNNEPDNGEQRIEDLWARQGLDDGAARVYDWNFYYAHVLIFKMQYCAIDSGHFYCPIPCTDSNGRTTALEEWGLIRKLNEIQGHCFIDSYFEKTGIRLTDEPLFNLTDPSLVRL